MKTQSTLRLVRSIMAKVRYRFEMRRYNDFTIAELFRKQGAQVGEGNRIEIRDLGTEPWLVRIGNHCTIGPFVSFLTHDGGTWLFTDDYPSLQKFGPIDIRDNCFIGLRSILLPNVTIGPNAIVAAGSVVTKDVSPGTIVGGVPTRVIATVEDYKKKVLRTWKEQKPPGYFRDLKDGNYYTPEYIARIKARDNHILREHLTQYLWKAKTSTGASHSPHDCPNG